MNRDVSALNATSKRPIIFPLRRLMAQQRASHATGIDRVELRYARWLLLEKAQGRTVIFVRQMKNVLYHIPDKKAEQVILNLWTRWIENKKISVNHFARKMDFNWFRLKSNVRNWFGPYIDLSILNHLHNKPAPILINVSYVGTEYKALHERLRKRLSADLYFYVHDIIPIEYPEYFVGKKPVSMHQKRLEMMALNAKTILVNSNYTAERFNSYCALQNLRVPPVVLLNIGVEEHFIKAAQSPFKISKNIAARINGCPFFITIGTIEPRKNHLLLLNVWRELAKESRLRATPCPKLVIVGGHGWENENVRDLLDRSPSIAPHVIEYNGLSDKMMIALIQQAKALLMPSFEEGWGIPVTEALTLNTPVICSDIPSLRECSQNQAVFIHPLDGLKWKSVIQEHTTTTRSCIKSFVPDTWEAHFIKLERIISECSRDSMKEGVS